MGLLTGERLFSAGLLFMAGVLILLIVFLLFMGLRKKKLERQLDDEYGKKRH